MKRNARGTDLARHFEAVHAGHAHVQEHGGEVLLLQCGQGLRAGNRAHHVRRRGIQRGLEGQQVGGLVVDQQDMGGNGVVWHVEALPAAAGGAGV